MNRIDTTYEVKRTLLLPRLLSFARCALRWSSKRPQRKGAIEDKKPSTITSGARSSTTEYSVVMFSAAMLWVVNDRGDMAGGASWFRLKWNSRCHYHLQLRVAAFRLSLDDNDNYMV
jgi:hypothetical protein